MKKLFFLTFVSCLFSISLLAQSAEKKGPQVLAKIAVLKLTAASFSTNNLGTIFNIFNDFYTAKQNINNPIVTGEVKPDVKIELEKIIKNRDNSLKQLFSPTEMNTFKTKIEAELAAEENK